METVQQKVKIGYQMFTLAPETLTLFDVATIEGLGGFRVIGKGGMIDKPIQLNGWEIVPAKKFKRNIPQEALDIVAVLKRYDSVISPKIIGFLIADDLRHPHLEKPAIEWSKVAEPIKQVDWGKVTEPVKRVDWDRVADTSGRIAKGGLKVAGAAVGVVALASVAFFALIPLLCIGALAYDPILIAVTEDSVTEDSQWVALYEWWD